MLELAQRDLGVVRYVSEVLDPPRLQACLGPCLTRTRTRTRTRTLTLTSTLTLTLPKSERSVLELACRQLAYKAAKAARLTAPQEADAQGEAGSSTSLPATAPLLPVAALIIVRSQIERVKDRLATLPGAAAATAPPPPLVLSNADSHFGSPSLPALLDASLGGTLLTPIATSSALAAEPVAVESAVKGVGVLGLYFAASGCSACRTATKMLTPVYSRLRTPQPVACPAAWGSSTISQRLEMVLVSLDEHEDEEYAHFCQTMPWLALPRDAGSLATRLSERFEVVSVPTLVLLRADGSLLSTDGLRLLRKHANSFPWSGAEEAPPMPHLSPLLDRVLPRGYACPGAYTELPRYRPVDFLRQPSSVKSLAEAVDAIRSCDEIATSLAVQKHCIKNTHFLIAALIEHTFTQLVPLPLPESHAKSKDSIWAQPILYAQQLDLLILLQRVVEHFAASVLSVAHTPATDATRMVVRPSRGLVDT